jgi:hypothetical protein
MSRSRLNNLQIFIWPTMELRFCLPGISHLSSSPHAVCAESNFAIGAIHFQSHSVLSP